MPTPAWDDLDVFVDTDDFAFICRFTPQAGGTPFDVPGIFDEAYQDVRLSEFQMATAPEPAFVCRAADVVNIKKHDQARIDGVDYDVTHDPWPDGIGMATVQLARAFR